MTATTQIFWKSRTVGIHLGSCAEEMEALGYRAALSELGERKKRSI